MVPDNKDNMIVLVLGSTASVRLNYLNNNMEVSFFEQEGIIKVKSTAGKGIPRAYVKCMVKKQNGDIEFYKDGFTNILGVFDYFSLNNLALQESAKQIAVFVNHEEFGSFVGNCATPTML